MKTNWQTKKLDDTCNVEYGTRVVNKRDGGSIYSVYGGGGATFFMDEYNREDCMVIARFAMSEKCTRFVGGKFFLNDSGLTVSPKSNKEIVQEFLDYQLISLNDRIYSLARGSAQKNLDLPAFRKVEISYPESLLEQHRIVKILDEVFEKVAKAKENAQKNLKNSKELFESYLQNVFVNSKYEYKLLGSVCNIIGGGTPSKTGSNFAKFYNGNIPWATVRDMKNDIIVNTEHKITREAVKNSATNIIPKGNVVIATRVGLGKICLIEGDTAVNQDLRGIVPIDPDKLLVGYLFQWLKSVAHIIKKEGTGATVQGVKLPFVKSLLIPIPKTLSEQKSIVKKFNVLSAETKKLEAIYKQKLADLDELKKSVLKKAFSGVL